MVTEAIKDGMEVASSAHTGTLPTVAATIVSSNEALLIPCLETLLKYRPTKFDLQIHVAWNGPGRGLARLSPELVKQFPEVNFVESFTSGFPPNQNILLGQLQADYYLILNDDLIFLPTSVEKPLEFMERPESAKIGMLGIKFLNRDGSLQMSTYSFAGLFRALFAISGLRNSLPLSSNLFGLAGFLGLGEGKSRYWLHDKTLEVETFRGSYMIVRDSAIKEVGLFDLMGGEETEWHMRFHKHGWKVVFYHEAEVIHLGSMTTSTDPASELIFLRSFLNFYYKHMPRWRYAAFRSGALLIYFAKYLNAKISGASRRREIVGRGVSMIVNWPQKAS